MEQIRAFSSRSTPVINFSEKKKDLLMKKSIILLSLFVFVTFAFGGNTSLAIKSALVPGMGQISAGVGDVKSFNTMKGLGVMAGFTFCLHGMLSSISQRESYAEQTQYYADQIAIANTNEKLLAMNKAQQNAYDNYESANTVTFVYLGLTAVIYGYGIVDAFLYTTDESVKRDTQSSLLPSGMSVTTGSVGQTTGLKVAYHF